MAKPLQKAQRLKRQMGFSGSTSFSVRKRLAKADNQLTKPAK
jgi:hypothetical protein